MEKTIHSLRTRYWRPCLTVIFWFSIFHLVRDILQLLGVQNILTEFLHYPLEKGSLPPYLDWSYFGGYRGWITLPIELSLVLIIPRIKYATSFVIADLLVAGLVTFTTLIWLVAVVASVS
jgi:hypothetical protein